MTPAGAGSPARLEAALAAGTAVNLAGILVRAALLFAHALVAARWFGAAAYGLYAAGLALANLLAIACQLGLPRAATRFVAAAAARGDAGAQRRTLRLALRIAAPVALLAGASVAGAAPAVSRAFGQPELAALLPLYAAAIPLLAVAAVLAGFSQGLGRMSLRVVALDLVAPATEVAALVGLALLGIRDRALPLAYLLSVAAGTSWLAVACAGASRAARRASPEANLARPHRAGPGAAELARFALPLWWVALLTEAGNRASVLLLSALAPPATVGVFGLLQRLVGLGGVFLHSVNGMFAPLVAGLVERRALPDLERLHRTAARWVFLVCLPSFCLLAFGAPFVLRVFGAEFETGSLALVILSLGVVADLLGGSSGVILMMSGHPRCNALNEAVRVALLLALGFALIPGLGLLGAAAAVALATICFSVLQILEVRWYLRIHPFGVHLLKALAAAAIMSAVLLPSILGAAGARGSVMRFVPFAAAGVAAYLAGLWVLGLAAEDRSLLAEALARARRLRGAGPAR